MDNGFVCLLHIDVGGKLYVAECPVRVPAGLLAEIGQMVGVVQSVVTVRKNSPAYHFISSAVGGIQQVSKVYSPCWDAQENT